MTSVLNSIGLMSEVDMLFHSRNPFFILQQFLWVSVSRIRQLTRRPNGFHATFIQHMRFLLYILLFKDSFGLVFMMTFLMRDVDELFHGLQAVTTFLMFAWEDVPLWLPLLKFFMFQFHYRMSSHRQGTWPERKYLFALDVVYHAAELVLAFLELASRDPLMGKVALFQHCLQSLAVLYHVYVLWTFFRWIKLTMPIVKATPNGTDRGGRFLSPAMSRLLLFLLEAQGGNVPMLRLFERFLRLQEQVRHLARALEMPNGVGPGRLPVAGLLRDPQQLGRLALLQDRRAANEPFANN